jgi:hypothetical protein
MDPGADAEAVIAKLIEESTGIEPAHEPEAARLPSGGVADFRIPAGRFDAPGRHLLVEVKSLHDLAERTRPWWIDFFLSHRDTPSTWKARTEWSNAGAQRIRNLGYEPADLSSIQSLRDFASTERLAALSTRGGQLFQLTSEANQIVAMLLVGSTVRLSQKQRWADRAVTGEFPGLLHEEPELLAAAHYASDAGRRGVARDIRTGLARKFDGYDGYDAALAVVVSDADTEDSWAALLDAQVSYTLDGEGPFLSAAEQPVIAAALTLGVCATALGGQGRWSYLDTGAVEVVLNFEALCRSALTRWQGAEHRAASASQGAQ